MPGGDRTGPAGAGPMTGRAAGYCAGYYAPGSMNPIGGGPGFWGAGRGGGRGGGGGWGRRNWFYATGLTGWQRGAMGWPAYATPSAAPFVPATTKEQELDGLKKQSAYFEDTLDGIRKRIQELESQDTEKIE